MANLLILANKRYHTDFRKYLMRAAERAGARALHIYCWEQVILSRNGSEYAVFPTDVDHAVVLREVREALGGGALLVLTGLGCNEAALVTRLQPMLQPATLIYDVYDDLMFNASGFEKVQRSLQDGIWRCRCPHIILLDDGLAYRYPGAHHIDNASHLQPLPGVMNADPRKMIYIGSLDKRVDFDWLEALATQAVTLSIYGRIHESALDIQDQLNGLLARHGNVKFQGGYDNDDLWSILPKYRVGVLPYRVDHPMTRHINPDKLYHYLNAGLEVLAAPIPQLQRHAQHVHLISTDGPWAHTLEAIVHAPRRGNWRAEEHSWDRRWAQLVHVLEKAAA